MKQYKVLCTSITGVGNRTLEQGQSYPENLFIHLQDHLGNKHVEEVVEPKPDKEKAVKNN